MPSAHDIDEETDALIRNIDMVLTGIVDTAYRGQELARERSPAAAGNLEWIRIAAVSLRSDIAGYLYPEHVEEGRDGKQ